MVFVFIRRFDISLMSRLALLVIDCSFSERMRKRNPHSVKDTRVRVSLRSRCDRHPPLQKSSVNIMRLRSHQQIAPTAPQVRSNRTRTIQIERQSVRSLYWIL